jgi:ABC-2 type transport system permease protein
MTSISIAREKENGTMEVLLVSPLKPLQIIIGKVVPYVFISFIIAMIILTLGAFVFGLVVKGSMIFLLAEITLFIIMALSLGILISTLARTQQIAMIISLMGLMLPSIILSGFIVPVENMPIALQWFSNIIPAKWFIIIIRSIILKGSGIALLWKETLILILMILVFVSISVKKFKIRLE